MKCSFGIFNFLEEISSLSHFVVFLYLFALIAEEGFLISPCYSLELCIQVGISFLFSFSLHCLKNDRIISIHFHGKPFNIRVIQVYAPTSNVEEAEVEQFFEDLQDLLEFRGLACKSRKSRNTWSNRQIWPWDTE